MSELGRNGCAKRKEERLSFVTWKKRCLFSGETIRSGYKPRPPVSLGGLRQTACQSTVSIHTSKWARDVKQAAKSKCFNSKNLNENVYETRDAKILVTNHSVTARLTAGPHTKVQDFAAWLSAETWRVHQVKAHGTGQRKLCGFMFHASIQQFLARKLGLIVARRSALSDTNSWRGHICWWAKLFNIPKVYNYDFSNHPRAHG